MHDSFQLVQKKCRRYSPFAEQSQYWLDDMSAQERQFIEILPFLSSICKERPRLA